MTKNLSLVFNLILAIAVGVLYFLHFKGTSSSTDSTEAIAASDSTYKPAVEISMDKLNTEHVVYVNTDTLLKYYEFIKVASKNLEARQKKAANSLAATENNLKGEIMEFQKKAQEGAFGQEEGARKEQELMTKQQQYMASKETQMAVLMEEEQKMSEQLSKKLKNYLERFSKDKSFKYVLGYTGQSSNILYKNDSLDITQPILKGLNEEFKAANKK